MLKKIFSREKKAKQKVIVVSGLPRSGTSMMMKMLAEGGVPVLTDSLREADEDNPNGYFEIELSKKLRDGVVDWIYEAPGKAVKVISYLLEFLPADLSYDVIFMDREIPEVLASQQKMLKRRNEESTISDAEMDQQFQSHLKAVKYWVARQPNMRVLFVKYDQAISDSEILSNSLVDFLEIPLNIDAMNAVPNKSLYRNKIQG